MPVSQDVYADLRQTYANGDLIIFAGAGVATAAGLPSWRQFAEELRDRIRNENGAAAVIQEIDSYIQKGRLVNALSAASHALGQTEFGHSVQSRFDDQQHDVPAVVKSIAELAPQLRAVITPNLDRLLDRAFLGAWKPVSDPPGDLARTKQYIFKLHGELHDWPSWIVTQNQVDRALFARPSHRTALETLYRAHPFLFIGEEWSDEDLQQTLAEIRTMSEGQPPTHFAFVPSHFPPYQSEMLQAAGIRLLRFDDEDELLRRLRSLGGDPASIVEEPAEAPGSGHLDPGEYLIRARLLKPDANALTELTERVSSALEPRRGWPLRAPVASLPFNPEILGPLAEALADCPVLSELPPLPLLLRLRQTTATEVMRACAGSTVTKEWARSLIMASALDADGLALLAAVVAELEPAASKNFDVLVSPLRGHAFTEARLREAIERVRRQTAQQRLVIDALKSWCPAGLLEGAEVDPPDAVIARGLRVLADERPDPDGGKPFLRFLEALDQGTLASRREPMPYRLLVMIEERGTDLYVPRICAMSSGGVVKQLTDHHLVPVALSALRDSLLHAQEELSRSTGWAETPESIEFFLPRKLLCADVENWHGKAGRRTRPVAGKHPVVVRSLERVSDSKLDDVRATWREKWKHAMERGQIEWIEPFDESGTSSLFSRLEQAHVSFVALKAPPPTAEIDFETDSLAMLPDAGIPLALWLRECGQPPPDASALLKPVLDAGPVHELPERVRQLRAQAVQQSGGDEQLVGRSLVLFWDDPDCTPANMMPVRENVGRRYT